MKRRERIMKRAGTVWRRMAAVFLTVVLIMSNAVPVGAYEGDYWDYWNYPVEWTASDCFTSYMQIEQEPEADNSFYGIRLYAEHYSYGFSGEQYHTYDGQYFIVSFESPIPYNMTVGLELGDTAYSMMELSPDRTKARAMIEGPYYCDTYYGTELKLYFYGDGVQTQEEVVEAAGYCRPSAIDINDLPFRRDSEGNLIPYIDYTIEVTQTDGGILNCYSQSAKEGEIVYLYPEPNTDRVLKDIVVNDGDVGVYYEDSGAYYFMMPDCNVVVSAEWEEPEALDESWYGQDCYQIEWQDTQNAPEGTGMFLDMQLGISHQAPDEHMHSNSDCYLLFTFENRLPDTLDSINVDTRGYAEISPDRTKARFPYNYYADPVFYDGYSTFYDNFSMSFYFGGNYTDDRLNADMSRVRIIDVEFINGAAEDYLYPVHCTDGSEAGMPDITVDQQYASEGEYVTISAPRYADKIVSDIHVYAPNKGDIEVYYNEEYGAPADYDYYSFCMPADEVYISAEWISLDPLDESWYGSSCYSTAYEVVESYNDPERLTYVIGVNAVHYSEDEHCSDKQYYIVSFRRPLPACVTGVIIDGTEAEISADRMKARVLKEYFVEGNCSINLGEVQISYEFDTLYPQDDVNRYMSFERIEDIQINDSAFEGSLYLITMDSYSSDIMTLDKYYAREGDIVTINTSPGEGKLVNYIGIIDNNIGVYYREEGVFYFTMPDGPVNLWCNCTDREIPNGSWDKSNCYQTEIRDEQTIIGNNQVSIMMQMSIHHETQDVHGSFNQYMIVSFENPLPDSVDSVSINGNPAEISPDRTMARALLNNRMKNLDSVDLGNMQIDVDFAYYPQNEARIAADMSWVRVADVWINDYDYQEILFNIEIFNSDGGWLTADYEYAGDGDLVTVVSCPDTGKLLEDMTITDASGKNIEKYYQAENVYNFYMPADNVVIRPVWKNAEPDSDPCTITKQPASCELAAGEKAYLSVEATGEGLTYQWQYLRPGATKWTNSGLSSAKKSTLAFTMSSGYDGMRFRCKVTDAKGNEVYSDPALVTLVEWISIMKQPVDVITGLGTKATFTVEASGEDLTYQWQYQKVGKTTWINSTSTGNKTNTMKVSATAGTNGFKFRCVMTDAKGHVAASDSALLTAVSGPEIVSHPESVKSAIGVPVSLSVTAEGESLTYKWQYQKPGTTSWKNSGLSSSSSATLRFTMSSGYDGMKFRCVVTDENGISTTSDAAVITAVEGPTITKQPEDAVATLGTKAMFSITAEGNGLTYQWQYQKIGKTTWVNSTSSGNKTDTLKVSATTGTDGMKFRCVVTDEDGVVATSNYATLSAQ